MPEGRGKSKNFKCLCDKYANDVFGGFFLAVHLYTVQAKFYCFDSFGLEAVVCLFSLGRLLHP